MQFADDFVCSFQYSEDERRFSKVLGKRLGKFGLELSVEWVESWNFHDIEKIIRHYAHNGVLVSPVAEKLLGNPVVEGIDAIKIYFPKGLQAYPGLMFTVLDVLHGDRSIVIFYSNQDGVKAGEFMELNSDGEISRMYAHYSE